MDTEDLDCGSNSCRYAKNRGGMRVNGPCRCDECPTCGVSIMPHRGHREWCTNKEWDHFKPKE